MTDLNEPKTDVSTIRKHINMERKSLWLLLNYNGGQLELDIN